MLKTWLRRMFIWVGPFLVLLVFVLSGFLFWVIGTSQGTRWALITAVHQLDGQAKGIAGTVWHGVYVDSLELDLPSVEIDLKGAHLRVAWRELMDRRLHVQDLSAKRLDLGLITTPDTQPSEPFTMPELPVYIAVDRLAVDQLVVRQDGNALPVDVSQVSAALALNNAGGQLVIQSLNVENQDVRLGLEGDIKVLGLADPWPFDATLAVSATASTEDSPLCARRYLPSLPVAVQVTDTPPAPILCSVALDASVSGSMDLLSVVLKGSGQDMDLDADAKLTLQGGFPLQEANIALRLPDNSTLQSQIQHEALQVDEAVQDRVYGWLRSDTLDVGQLAGSIIPPAILTARADFDVRLQDLQDLLSADIDLAFAEGSQWNTQPLVGSLTVDVNSQSAPADHAADAAPAPLWQQLRIAALDVDLKLGRNHVKTQGSLGSNDSQLTLDILAPELAAFWPDLPGGVTLQGQVQGNVQRHQLDVTASYTPENSTDDQLGTAPADAHVVVAGGWGPGPTPQDPLVGWRGRIDGIDVSHAGLGLNSRSSTPVSFLPDAVAPAWQWQVGAADLELSMSDRPVVTVSHQASRGGAGRWETRGAIDSLAVSQRLIDDIKKILDIEARQEADQGSVKISSQEVNKDLEIVFGADWDLQFDQTLQGQAHIKHLSGDIMVPAEPPVPLGLQDLTIDINASKATASSSNVEAVIQVHTKEMGRISATARTLLHTTPGGGMTINPDDLKTLTLDADIDDLGWTSLFLDDSMELGGAVQADVQLQSRPDGTWKTNGNIAGQNIKVLRIDDGVRLLDGTLAARLDDDRLILERLYFPARLRAVPKEWRTAEWVSTNPDAKDGGLTLTGEWNIFDSEGAVNIDLYRYPILQRADRYAMVTGKLTLDAKLPSIAITGEITADAGWFDLDMLGGIPTVDSDVVVIRAGDEHKEPAVPMDISLELDVDLGPRFYLTGYGLNSGLVGELHVTMRNNKLTGIGALRTRGGAIEAYGQRLQLRKGRITFQSDITNPILDIEALRTGLAVEAGVRVAGTAKRPRIDLVSYPDVSEIEKLSWLLMGHGPDDSGGDVALLLSVGTSFLGTGEPFYRKFGIDEVSMRSGELGSAGSILPVESVVSGLDAGTSDIERRFIVISKGFSNRITLSIRQALSDTGTVGHASYQLMRNLTAELSVGTVNGLALVYRWFSRD